MAERESQIVLGLDPHPSRLWPVAAELPAVGPFAAGSAAARAGPATMSGVVAKTNGLSAAERAAAAVELHCRAVIDAAGAACVAVKPQLACFERLGAAGRRALDEILEHARARGLLVIADGKRGDVDVTAEAYAQGLYGGLPTPFGDVSGMAADLATVNPLMGTDTIEPFVAGARAAGAGALVLVRTSNPGAADLQDLELAGGGVLWERLARIVCELGEPGIGESGLSDVGAVVGATVPEHVARARELMPNAVFLLPGIGAQGGRVDQLAPAFAPGRAGGLVSASRGIVDAYRQAGGEPAAAARAEAERLRAIAWKLA